LPCIFCEIATGKAKAEIVYEDDVLVAFLDAFPLRPGHLQIIPKEHHKYFDDLPEHTACSIATTGQKLARGLKRMSSVQRVAFVFTGGDVDHAHAHLIPMHENTDVTSRR